ncbi:MAG: DinB family protein [Longimicrobiales bacterium]
MRDREQRPADNEYNEYYGRYIERVPNGDIVVILRGQIEKTCGLIEKAGDAKAGHAYAPGKWTVREVIGHLADGERIFAYRALRFAREDQTPLPGFDQNVYVPTGRFEKRSLASLVDEFRAVRAASVALYDSFDADAWSKGGHASDMPVTVRALAWLTAGHELHHRALLAERYFT